MAKTPLELTGQKFGKLTVLRRTEGAKDGRSRWECRCDCGNIVIRIGRCLKRGISKSCDCYRSSITFKHGHANPQTREYKAWAHMKQRCLNKSSKHYQTWGGRGIEVCARWKDNFEAFLADMGNCPSGYSLERIDNDGNYSPENCKWATKQAQCSNKRTNRFVVINGDRITHAEACRRAGIRHQTLNHRIARGWPEERWFEPLLH